MQRFKVLSLVFFLIISSSIISQEKQQDVEHTIDSKVFGKERKVKVFLPKRYLRDSISKFAVTYVLDAQHQIFWDVIRGNSSYMVDNYSVMPMIVVGIVSDNRGSEFNPNSTKLQEHIETEIFPLIEENYRVDNFRTIVGDSWGGAFVGNTLFSNKRDMFDAYIGISPSFGDKDNVIEKHADSLLKLKTNFKKYLYLSHGDVGRRELEFGGYVSNIDSLLQAYPNKSLAWLPSHVKNVGHWQIVGPSYCEGLLSMSRNYFADQKVIEDMVKQSRSNLAERLAAFNANQQANFGYVHKASANYLRFVGNDYKSLDDYEIALQLYEMALKLEPENVRLHSSISETYDKIGDIPKAKVAFTKTKQLLDEQKANFSDNYYNNMTEWINEKLESYK